MTVTKNSVLHLQIFINQLLFCFFVCLHADLAGLLFE